MAPSTTYSSAKDFLDKIGEEVYKEVKNGGAEKYKGELKGNLQKANGRSSELSSSLDPCMFDYTTRLGARGDPCGTRKNAKNEDVKRFSDTLGGQCTHNRIKDSNKDDNKVGACAPYRRLYLCDKNLETISNYDSNNARHNLLAEVCMAAYYEGDLIKTHYTIHKHTNNDSASQLCTVLARSFADIGDIVRGKDLYLGYDDEEKKQRKQLEDNLKKIFGKIHSEVTSDKNVELKTRYDGDGPEFFKLREDWWYANRRQVWKAITCKADASSAYFRTTCNSDDKKGPSQANKYCRCGDDKPGSDKPNTDPPTYFDYVPQYLRWFEEWAEDFCRKKKKKLEDVKTYCRDEKEKYCSGNGYDCTKTIYKKGRIVVGYECTSCSVWCRMYEKWIDNQKKEFLKQKRKYTSEMQKYTNGASKGTTPIKTANGKTINNLYVKEFYEEFKKKGNYGTVDAFLGLLNKEEVCTKITEDDEKIDFKTVGNRFDKNINNKGTFYHSEYCQPCPDCGMKWTKKDGKGKWEQKKGGKCDDKKRYNITSGAPSTDIDVLSFGDKREDIRKKIDDFCNKTSGSSVAAVGSGDCGTNIDSSLCEKWQCYKHEHVQKDGNAQEDDDDEVYDNEVETGGGLCILENPKKNKGKSEANSQNEPEQFQKTFNEFFYFWIVRFLNDSMYWRGKINNCIEKAKKGQCKKGCNTNCECFLKWITQKQNEWGQIKTHFNTQNFGPQVENGESGMLGGLTNSADVVLKTVLNIEDLFNNIKSGYGDVKETEGINKMLDEEKKREEAGVVGGGKDNTTIDKILKHEGDDATKCKGNNPEKCEKKPPDGDPGARSLPPAVPSSPAATDTTDAGDSSDEEEEEEEEEEKAEGENPDGKGDVQEETAKKATETTQINVCDIVKDILTKDKLQEACQQKYDGKYYGWKCVSSGDKAATSGVVTTTRSSGEPTSDKDGAICVPPRRRRLYIHKVDDGEFDDDKSLRDWFVKSAAVETFFAWHKYKQEKKKPQGDVESIQLQVPGGAILSSDDPENQLKSGKIPPDFLRQMFYTLGDYRDICVGAKEDVIKALEASGDKNIKEISEKIEKILKQIGSKPASDTPTVPQNNDEQRNKWWDNNAKHIWEGMVCALTYKENNDGSMPTKGEKQNTQITQIDGAQNLLKKIKEEMDEYHYKNVKLKDEPSDTQPKPYPSGTGTVDTPTLDSFIKRPPYFRYLEEWGETFCRQRTRMLKNVKKACREKDDDEYKCSGDGHDCTDDTRRYNNMFANLDCRDCYKQCRKYRKWIDIKFEEFRKQEKKYEGEHEKLKTNSSKNVGADNNCCTEIQKHSSAAQFLKVLKHCKDGEGDKEKGDEYQKNKLDFDKIPQTFSRSTYCETCPYNIVNCNGRRGRGRRGKDPCTEVKKNGETWDSVFNANGENSTEITVEMIDRRWPFIKEYLENSNNSEESNDLFTTSPLFKGIRVQNWKCKFENENKDVCYLKNFNPEIDLNQYTTFKVFLEYWLEDFLYGYYISKRKIDLCTKNNEHTIIEGCKCKCVEEWLNQKTKEWEQIKTHFKKQDRGEAYPIESKVKDFFQQGLFDSDVEKAIKPFESLDKLEESIECNATMTSEKKEGSKRDLVKFLLNILQKKIKPCQTEPDQKTQCHKSPPPDEYEESPEDDTSTTSVVPEFCEQFVKPEAPPPKVPEIPKEEDKDKRDEEKPASPTDDVDTDSAGTEKLPTPPAPAPVPRSRPKQRKKQKRQITPKEYRLTDVLLPSAFPLSVGIAFVALSYFVLKVRTMWI